MKGRFGTLRETERTERKWKKVNGRRKKGGAKGEKKSTGKKGTFHPLHRTHVRRIYSKRPGLNEDSS